MDFADSLKREIGRAFRSLARSPGFTVIVLITLALGIGATTAIFTMLDRVVLHPLPFTDSNQLVWIDSPTPGVKPDSRWKVSAAEFFYFKNNSRTLRNVAAFMTGNITVTGRQAANRVSAAGVSASIFDVLGLHASLGRLLMPSDNLPHATPVVVISYDYWRNQLASDPRVVGTMINLATTPHLIVGVLQPDASLPDAASPKVDLWLPAELNPSAQAINEHYLPVVARLAPGATIQSAQAELARFTAQLPDLFPTAYTPAFMKQTGFRTEVLPLRTHVVGDIATRLWILLGAVGLVLVIACANVANLFLVRAEGRHREVAIRSALGAKRSDLAWQYLTETMVLSLVAGAGAVALAFIGLRAMVAAAPPELPRMAEVHLGWMSVLFTAAASVASGVLFGFLTLLAAGQPAQDTTMLREGGRGLTSSRTQQFARGALVVAQTAFALVLLAAAGLMLQSFRNMRHVSLGFEPANILTAEISLPNARYNTYEKVETFYHTLLTRVKALPGVRDAAVGDFIPLSASEVMVGGFGGCASIWVEDHPLSPGEDPPCIPVPTGSPDYLRTLGIKVRGTEPSWNDVESTKGGVVVTEALASRLWPGEDPIGKGIRGNGNGPPFYRVVGVANDFRGDALDKPPVQAVFFPLVPISKGWLWSPRVDVTVLVRTNGVSPQTLTAPLRRVMTDLDPNVPLANIRTMDDVVSHSMVRLSFTMELLAIAAAMALILSTIGIYGVISYIVGRRTSEIGIRMALGAQASRVGSLVVLQSLKLTAIGVVIGIMAALGVTRALRSVLFDVSPTDPVTLLSVSAIMLIVAVIASYVPAHRAMSVDPVEALRAD
jgi:putative ABC transport system permease protein